MRFLQITLPRNCIFCIDQFVSILQKVIKDYYVFTKGKMKMTELLYISKQLFKVSSSLFKYIKTSNDYDRLNEYDRIEHIKK